MSSSFAECLRLGTRTCMSFPLPPHLCTSTSYSTDCCLAAVGGVVFDRVRVRVVVEVVVFALVDLGCNGRIERRYQIWSDRRVSLLVVFGGLLASRRFAILAQKHALLAEVLQVVGHEVVVARGEGR